MKYSHICQMDCVTVKSNNTEVNFTQQLLYMCFNDGGYDRLKCLTCFKQLADSDKVSYVSCPF
jgi:hypothetical protein